MTKKLSRSLILAFFLIVFGFSYYFQMYIWSHFGIFWLGFVISAIIFKEMDSLTAWVIGKGIPIKMGGEEDGNRSKDKGQSIGEGKQKADRRNTKAKATRHKQ